MATWVKALASLRFTLVILALLGAGILVSYQSEVRTTWALVVPLLLFAVNLSAAVATNPAFRSQVPLLVFHLALLSLILLVAAGRLTYLKGHVELSEGEAFGGQLTGHESGPWHQWRLDGVWFVNEGFTIDYAPGPKRGNTWNRVRWRDAAGAEQVALIGDQKPLVLRGYRFYTSFNKGFAPVFEWHPAQGGRPVAGTVHLPSYPAHESSQAQEWEVPGTGEKLWIMLQFDEVILAPDRPSQFRPPQRHVLVVRRGEVRQELRPGDHLDLAQGRLAYRGLTQWMGYTVYSDWTLPWLFAACAVAAASLGLHFWNKFSARPWDQPPPG